MTKRSSKHGTTLRVATAAAIVLALAFFGVYALNAAKGDGALLGFISSVQGKATLNRGKMQTSLDGMNALRAGDVVHVGAKSSVVVNLCGLSQRIRLQGAAIFVVDKNGLRITKGKPGAKVSIEKSFCQTLMASAAKYDKAAYIKSDTAESAGAMSMLGFISSKSAKGGGLSGGGLRGAYDDTGSGGGQNKQLEIIEYEKAKKQKMDEESNMEGAMAQGEKAETVPEKSYDESEKRIIEAKIMKPNVELITEPPREVEVFPRPEFGWTPMEFAASYGVAIFDDADAQVFTATATRPFLTYPSNAAPLVAGGKYICEIAARDENGMEVGEDAFGLAVRDNIAQANFRREESALRGLTEKNKRNPDAFVVLGRFYESYGMLPAAADIYGKALALDPKNTALRDQLTELKKKL